MTGYEQLPYGSSAPWHHLLDASFPFGPLTYCQGSTGLPNAMNGQSHSSSHTRRTPGQCYKPYRYALTRRNQQKQRHAARSTTPTCRTDMQMNGGRNTPRKGHAGQNTTPGKGGHRKKRGVRPASVVSTRSPPPPPLTSYPHAHLATCIDEKQGPLGAWANTRDCWEERDGYPMFISESKKKKQVDGCATGKKGLATER
ncbi:hypothetical protein COCMIDRAFT_29546 [Bipolaris oryzae ATCC 44560]|uniref:Uncharacterized protein n=1 Tax=Bipolaris oryzae ATCC 44560 TaxID=930090 RepID=W6Z269_COCMI|nr:uncharacterized protein COCMIDRAFT_29546 [Bipolaris oryzae ATCC 44560]EUC41729.1 hypothetical protein COCMIDRAFT_29546 [Bipolaris oryzae ATCC 44560]